MASDIVVIARRTLISVLGVVAGLGVVTTTIADESGRVVAASARPDGSVAIEHIRGPEYLRSYADIVGVWTICDGLTRGVRRGQVETREGCALRVERELVIVGTSMLACVPTLREPGRDYQRWAIVSLAYNAGTSAICSSTAAKRFRARDWRAGCEAFLRWDKAGRPLRSIRGLTLRRQRERQICLTGLTGYPASTLDARMATVR